MYYINCCLSYEKQMLVSALGETPLPHFAEPFHHQFNEKASDVEHIWCIKMSVWNLCSHPALATES